MATLQFDASPVERLIGRRFVEARARGRGNDRFLLRRPTAVREMVRIQATGAGQTRRPERRSRANRQSPPFAHARVIILPQ